MLNKFESLVREVYRKNKMFLPVEGDHLSEEDLASFLDGTVNAEEGERIKAHLICCESCAEVVALSINTADTELMDVPERLLNRVKEILSLKGKLNTFEIFLRLKDNFFEVINSTGDILVGQELIPAPILRSRNINDFKEGIIILKDLENIRIEVRVESKGGRYIDLLVKVINKIDQAAAKNLRATLIKDALELESYISSSGLFNFEHVLLGNYMLEIFSNKERLALIVLDVKD